MYEFLRKLGSWMRNPWSSEDHLPCYINRATVVDEFDTYKKIREYIELCKAEKQGRIGMLLFSVTEEDKHYKKWLYEAKKKGYTVVNAPSIHGAYQCWAIFVPNDKLGQMDYR